MYTAASEYQTDGVVVKSIGRRNVDDGELLGIKQSTLVFFGPTRSQSFFFFFSSSSSFSSVWLRGLQSHSTDRQQQTSRNGEEGSWEMDQSPPLRTFALSLSRLHRSSSHQRKCWGEKRRRKRRKKSVTEN